MDKSEPDIQATIEQRLREFKADIDKVHEIEQRNYEEAEELMKSGKYVMTGIGRFINQP